MKILNKIVDQKKKEIIENRKLIPISELNKSPMFLENARSLSESIKEGNGIVSEFKRKSPSAGELPNQGLETVVKGYDALKVSGLSILTDNQFFGGSIEDLIEARELTKTPILRKDFIIDEYQLFEAKAFGADAILLIASILDEYHAKYLTSIAKSLGLEVLMEFHSAEELKFLNEDVDIIGINNRNLDTLKTDINVSVELSKYLPYDKVRITESGIKSVKDITLLKEAGFDGFLIGESLLKQPELLNGFSQTLEKSTAL